MSDTKCYMVILADLTDRQKFMAGYAVQVAPMIERYGGRYVLRGRGVEFLEEAWGGTDMSLIISEWPDKATARAWWNSDEYQEAKKLREGLGTFQVLLVDASLLGS